MKEVTNKDLQYVFSVSHQAIANWQKEDDFPEFTKKGKSNQYDLQKVVAWRIAKLTERKVSDYELERTRLTKAQADKAEIETKILEHDLLQASAVEKEWADILSVIKSKFMATETKIVIAVQGESDSKKLKLIIRRLLNETLEEIIERESNQRHTQKSDRNRIKTKAKLNG